MVQVQSLVSYYFYCSLDSCCNTSSCKCCNICSNSTSSIFTTKKVRLEVNWDSTIQMSQEKQRMKFMEFLFLFLVFISITFLSKYVFNGSNLRTKTIWFLYGCFHFYIKTMDFFIHFFDFVLLKKGRSNSNLLGELSSFHCFLHGEYSLSSFVLFHDVSSWGRFDNFYELMFFCARSWFGP